jgi:hypothetical protein
VTPAESLLRDLTTLYGVTVPVERERDVLEHIARWLAQEKKG